MASPAIDTSMFRDGEVRRIQAQFRDWAVVCDEIVRLKQRFCSLRNVVRGSDGAIAGVLTVSSGDDGRPAALVTIRGEEKANSYIELLLPIASASSKAVKSGKKSGEADKRYLNVERCIGGACSAIWLLGSAGLASLNSDKQIRLRLLSIDRGGAGSATVVSDSRSSEITFETAGFRDALAFSLEQWRQR